MKILVVGANGRVGLSLVRTLAKQGHIVYAAARQNNFNFVEDNVYFVELNLLTDLLDIQGQIEPLNVDVIYFTAGSRGKNLLQVDTYGAIKIMQVAEKLNIQRFIMLSSVFSLQPERWNTAYFKNLKDYKIAKYLADHWLINTSLEYTILQPGTLLEVAGTGKIQINVDQPLPNSIDNVVNTLVAILTATNTIGQVITMADGEFPIVQALTQITESSTQQS